MGSIFILILILFIFLISSSLENEHPIHIAPARTPGPPGQLQTELALALPGTTVFLPRKM
ncbi:MAG: hypothetical protein DRI34_02135 [Deltaproteobacteria bacterium]|nr:MAG: hypothetical protein DRI34_02135 [Deltaproteobacteria bacterium]